MKRRLVAAVAASVFTAGPALALEAPNPTVFSSSDGGVLRVQGMGGYFGSLEATRNGNRYAVVNELDFERYIMGLAEMPPSWNMEALKAQAVAARSYAMWEIKRGNWKKYGYDVCGTTACQVFDGVAPIERTYGERWAQAVRETEGEVLLSDGQPILARFHSSSGGRTLANEIVYPSSGARSYLPAVDDPADSVSPLHEWSVRFTDERMHQVLSRAFQLEGVLTEINTDPVGRIISIKTQGGELRMNIVRFRREVSAAAQNLYPGDYPSDRGDGQKLPLVLPSSRFEVTRDGSDWVIEGRGYGHGVGMSQWGAKGMADSGTGYADILAHYYGGLRPVVFDGVPKTVRVGLTTSARELIVEPSGPMAIPGVTEGTLGQWILGPNAGLEPPQTWEETLRIEALAVPTRVEMSQTDTVDIALNVPKHSVVTAVLSRDGKEISRSAVVAAPGRVALEVPLSVWRIRKSGEHRVEIQAFDGVQTVSSEVALDVRRPGRFWAVVASLLVAIAVGWTWWTRPTRQETARVTPNP